MLSLCAQRIAKERPRDRRAIGAWVLAARLCREFVELLDEVRRTDDDESDQVLIRRIGHCKWSVMHSGCIVKLMRKKRAKNRKSEQVVFRLERSTRQELEKVRAALGEEYSASDVLRRIVELFLDQGIEKAATRIKQGGWEAAGEWEATLRRVSAETVIEVLQSLRLRTRGGRPSQLMREIFEARAAADAEAADAAGTVAEQRHKHKEGQIEQEAG